MAETLLSISEVLLYGRVMEDMTYEYKAPPSIASTGIESAVSLGQATGGNAELQKQLSPGTLSATAAEEYGARFARIYGFSYEGSYYNLDAPIIMLVHGKGIAASNPKFTKTSAANTAMTAAEKKAAKLSATAYTPDRIGTATQEVDFADDIMVWSYDKADFSIRLDSLSGSIEDILLEVEIGNGMGGGVSGGRVSGGRVSGGRVSGGRVSGGRVSGGRVSGGRVSGGKDD